MHMYIPPHRGIYTFLFFYFYVYVTCTRVYAQRSETESGPLELEFQVVVNRLMWVLGAKLAEQQVRLTTKPAP